MAVLCRHSTGLKTKVMSLDYLFRGHDIDDSEIIDYLERNNYSVIKNESIIDAEKLEYFTSVFKDYSIQQIEQLLPRK